MFKPYKPKAPKDLPGVNVRIAGQLKKQMGPVKPGKKLRFWLEWRKKERKILLSAQEERVHKVAGERAITTRGEITDDPETKAVSVPAP